MRPFFSYYGAKYTVADAMVERALDAWFKPTDDGEPWRNHPADWQEKWRSWMRAALTAALQPEGKGE